ncbi:MAG: imidazole glycerol phosphate synthase subunit HisH [Bacteroidota bacterium]
MIGLIDYASGNITSVSNALAAIGVEFIVSNRSAELETCSGIILPGVGAAPKAMESIENNNLAEFLRSCRVPLLGICLGMELLYERSEEGNTPCLGLLSGRVKKFNSETQKIPHMGWNNVHCLGENSLVDEIGNVGYFYFAHSYYVSPDSYTTAISEAGISFASMVQEWNYYGVQFHPEKSGEAGLRLLKKFCGLCK